MTDQKPTEPEQPEQQQPEQPEQQQPEQPEQPKPARRRKRAISPIEAARRAGGL